jgi:hypothetical protein
MQFHQWQESGLGLQCVPPASHGAVGLAEL